MTEQDAIDYVRVNADTNTEPALSAAELENIVSVNRLADREGNAPGVDGWVPTFFLARAVYQAFDLRAARAATWVDFSGDGTSLTQSQVSAGLLRQAKLWRKRTTMGVR